MSTRAIKKLTKKNDLKVLEEIQQKISKTNLSDDEEVDDTVDEELISKPPANIFALVRSESFIESDDMKIIDHCNYF